MRLAECLARSERTEGLVDVVESSRTITLSSVEKVDVDDDDVVVDFEYGLDSGEGTVVVAKTSSSSSSREAMMATMLFSMKR